MQKGPYAFERFNTFRALDWRRQRAETWAEKGKPRGWVIDDEAFGKLFRHLRRLRSCVDDKARKRVQESWPAYWAAQRLANTDDPLRWTIQASILAGQSDDEIAAASEVPADVIQAFEEYFFNVRDRLSARDWILLGVLRGGLATPLRLDDPERSCMTLAYYGGHLIIPSALTAAMLLREHGDKVFSMALPQPVADLARLIRLLSLPWGAAIPPHLRPKETERTAPVLLHTTGQTVDPCLRDVLVGDLLKKAEQALQSSTQTG